MITRRDDLATTIGKRHCTASATTAATASDPGGHEHTIGLGISAIAAAAADTLRDNARRIVARSLNNAWSHGTRRTTATAPHSADANAERTTSATRAATASDRDKRAVGIAAIATTTADRLRKNANRAVTTRGNRAGIGHRH